MQAIDHGRRFARAASAATRAEAVEGGYAVLSTRGPSLALRRQGYDDRAVLGLLIRRFLSGDLIALRARGLAQSNDPRGG